MRGMAQTAEGAYSSHFRTCPLISCRTPLPGDGELSLLGRLLSLLIHALAQLTVAGDTLEQGGVFYRLRRIDARGAVCSAGPLAATRLRHCLRVDPSFARWRTANAAVRIVAICGASTEIWAP